MRTEEPLLLSVRQAAALAGVSLTVGYRYVRCGEWPQVRIGLRRRGVRVPIDGLRKWIESETVGGVAAR